MEPVIIVHLSVGPASSSKLKKAVFEPGSK